MSKQKQYEVEKILAIQINILQNKQYYLVKWKNWPLNESTWEPEENMLNIHEAIEEYKERKKKNKIFKWEEHPILKSRWNMVTDQSYNPLQDTSGKQTKKKSRTKKTNNIDSLKTKRISKRNKSNVSKLLKEEQYEEQASSNPLNFNMSSYSTQINRQSSMPENKMMTEQRNSNQKRNELKKDRESKNNQVSFRTYSQSMKKKDQGRKKSTLHVEQQVQNPEAGKVILQAQQQKNQIQFETNSMARVQIEDQSNRFTNGQSYYVNEYGQIVQNEEGNEIQPTITTQDKIKQEYIHEVEQSPQEEIILQQPTPNQIERAIKLKIEQENGQEHDKWEQFEIKGIRRCQNKTKIEYLVYNRLTNGNSWKNREHVAILCPNQIIKYYQSNILFCQFFKKQNNQIK